jgi:hypothetical protein
MTTFWAIAHEQNPEMLFAASHVPALWVREEHDAMRFDCEDAALNHTVAALNGRGVAVKVSTPRFLETRRHEVAAL